MDHTDATDQKGLLGEDEVNMWSSVFCICLERCESMAKAWESRPVLRCLVSRTGGGSKLPLRK